jgi:hypothetical protein
VTAAWLSVVRVLLAPSSLLLLLAVSSAGCPCMTIRCSELLLLDTLLILL